MGGGNYNGSSSRGERDMRGGSRGNHPNHSGGEVPPDVNVPTDSDDMSSVGQGSNAANMGSPLGVRTRTMRRNMGGN